MKIPSFNGNNQMVFTFKLSKIWGGRVYWIKYPTQPLIDLDRSLPHTHTPHSPLRSSREPSPSPLAGRWRTDICLNTCGTSPLSSLLSVEELYELVTQKCFWCFSFRLIYFWYEAFHLMEFRVVIWWEPLAWEQLGTPLTLSASHSQFPWRKLEKWVVDSLKGDL